MMWLNRYAAPAFLASLIAGATAAQAANLGVPGSLNYVEGQVTLNQEVLGPHSIGQAILERDGVLDTTSGRAEVLLSPGVFLRVGDNSEIRMVSPDLVNTRVEVVRGEALLEADGLIKDSHLQILQDHSSTQIEKNGLYDFNAERNLVAVYDGKAQVTEGDQTTEVKSGHEAYLSLEPGKLHPQKFNKDDHDALYAWSNVRSQYLAQASADSVKTVVVANSGWFGPGWYWNPYWSSYAWLPGAGIGYSPFGFGFYSPVAFYGGYYGGGFYGGRTGFAGRSSAFGSVRSSAAVSGFRSSGAASGFAGRGFSGGGGGFAGRAGGFGHR